MVKVLGRLAIIFLASALAVLGLVNYTSGHAEDRQERQERQAVPVMSCADTYNPAYCD